MAPDREELPARPPLDRVVAEAGGSGRPATEEGGSWAPLRWPQTLRKDPPLPVPRAEAYSESDESSELSGGDEGESFSSSEGRVSFRLAAPQRVQQSPGAEALAPEGSPLGHEAASAP